MIRPSRDSGRGERHLAWRVRIFAVGAVIALAGMYLGLDWVVNVALAVLLVGFGLRFLPERDREDGADAQG